MIIDNLNCIRVVGLLNQETNNPIKGIFSQNDDSYSPRSAGALITLDVVSFQNIWSKVSHRSIQIEIRDTFLYFSDPPFDILHPKITIFKTHRHEIGN